MLATGTSPNGHDAPHGDDDAPRTLDLLIDPPVEWNNNTYESLHLEEPTAYMVERAESELSGNVNVHSLRKYQIALVSQCSGVPRQVVERMRISQVRQASDFLSSFIAAGQQTGES